MADIHIEKGMSGDGRPYLGFQPPLSTAQQAVLSDELPELTLYFARLPMQANGHGEGKTVYGIDSEVISRVRTSKMLTTTANLAAQALRGTGATVRVHSEVRQLGHANQFFNKETELVG